MDQNFQKVSDWHTSVIKLILFQLYLFHFFPSWCKSRQIYKWSRLLVSKYPEPWFSDGIWNPVRPEVAKVLWLQTYHENPSFFSKTTALKSCIKTKVTLSYYYMTRTLKNLWLCSFNWPELFHQDLHRQFFFAEKRVFIKIFRFMINP